MTKAELLSALKKIGNSQPPTSTRFLASGKREPERSEERAPEQAKVGESSPLASPPPHPSAPQYLTPKPVEVYQGEEGPVLPDHLPVTVLEAMPRDPHWVFLYWDVSSERKAAIQSQYGEWIFERSLSMLRVHDIEEGTWREVPVLLDARNWYLPVVPDRPYEFELGLIIPSGEFVPLASSKRVRTPAAEPTFHEEEKWVKMEEYYQELFDVYGEFAPGSCVSSPGEEGLRKREGARIGWSAITSITSRGKPR